jgi:carbamoyltransferase
LGGRSILANPLIKEMRDKLNLSVKHREAWRPFCPSMTEENFETYFGHTKPADHMIIAYTIKEEFQNLFPSAVHVDGSVRPQTVRRETNPRYHELLSEFGKLTGHPILINTSFNIQGEPIVETPRDALRCFGGTGLDVLVMGDYVVRKPSID